MSDSENKLYILFNDQYDERCCGGCQERPCGNIEIITENVDDILEHLDSRWCDCDCKSENSEYEDFINSGKHHSIEYTGNGVMGCVKYYGTVMIWNTNIQFSGISSSFDTREEFLKILPELRSC